MIATRLARSNQSAAAASKNHFTADRCTVCHSEKLGGVNGLSSKLLLHDMGADLGDVGVYGTVARTSSDDADALPQLASANEAKRSEVTQDERAKSVGALGTSGARTPLWGVGNSAPYLHHGRASTLNETSALHGGAGL